MEKIGIIGAGSWGTTLANLLSEKGFLVDLWVFEHELFKIIQDKSENTYYLPGISLSNNLNPYTSLEDVCKDKKVLILVTPSHVLREVLQKASPYIKDDVSLVIASKGIEYGSFLPLNLVIKEVLSNMTYDLFCLSGPSFAGEVSRKIPTAVALSGEDEGKTKEIQKIFSTPYFRIYTNKDLLGVALGGALKNIIAIAVGVSDGLGLGFSTRAALITRGLREITRLGVRLGAEVSTFSGLAGLGDLVLTCTSDLSRNRTVGKRLAEGVSLEEIQSGMKMIAEGIICTKSAYFLAKKHNIDMPVTEKVYQILYENLKPEQAAWELMGRELKEE
ncbi:MAG: NAD(P)H-dependent glycerol-3-phosphate dehydrogenase [Thermodesulfobacteriota bacterium]|nr:NAD(P)H-dependent glycerol-3-phosphate dehydrogenase [Thermodesulfobacteriota bacterium]